MNILLSICVCFLVICGCSLGQKDWPLRAGYDPMTSVKVKPGTRDVLFTCDVNRHMDSINTIRIHTIHVNPVTSTETILSTNAKLVGDIAEFYSVWLNHYSIGKQLFVFFKILKVRHRDDGIIRCLARTGPDQPGPTEESHVDRELVVLRPVTSLNMKLGDFPAYGDSPKHPLEMKPGVYDVSCIAKGSNPGTEYVRMSLNGKPVSQNKTVTTSMGGNVRRYKTVSSGKVKVMVSHSGQKLVCEAKDPTGQSKYVRRVVKLDKKIPKKGNGMDNVGDSSGRGRDGGDENRAGHRVDRVSVSCLHVTCAAVFWLSSGLNGLY